MADKKRLSLPQIKYKRLFGMEPLEPIALGQHCKHGYKGRDKLPTNYLAKRRNRLLRYATDSQPCTFVREGLDNFRASCPPADNLIIHGPRDGFLPMIAHRVPRPPPRKTKKMLPKGAELISKLSPAHQTQKAFVEETEASLTQHPLASDPDPKESLASDVLLKVLEVLHPDKKLEDTWAYSEGVRDREKSSTKLCTKGPDKVNLGPPNQVTLGPPNQVNQGSPDQVTPGPPVQVNQGSPDQVTPGPPGQVNQGSSDQVTSGPSEQVNQESPDQVTQGPPDQVNQGSSDQVTSGPSEQVNQASPDQVTQGPPDQVNQGSSEQVNQESPDQVTQGPRSQVNQGPLKESFLSYLMKLSLKEKKKKKSSRTRIPKGERRKEEDIL